MTVTSGSEAKANWCRQLGADRVIDYRHENVEQALREFAPQGLDVYWDAVGKPDLELAVSVAARRGRIVLMSGMAQRAVLPVGPFYTHGCTLIGFTVTDAATDELADRRPANQSGFGRRHPEGQTRLPAAALPGRRGPSPAPAGPPVRQDRAEPGG